MLQFTQRYEPVLQRNASILHGKIQFGRTSLMGGDPLVAKKRFCTKSSKKSISLGNLTVVSLQTKKHLLRHTRIVHSFVSCFELSPQILLAVALGHCALAFTFPSKYSIYPVLKNILSIFLIFYLLFCVFVFLCLFNISPDPCPKIGQK